MRGIGCLAPSAMACGAVRRMEQRMSERAYEQLIGELLDQHKGLKAIELIDLARAEGFAVQIGRSWVKVTKRNQDETSSGF